jgi:ABC-type lipoprotein release transport system permease subunit
LSAFDQIDGSLFVLLTPTFVFVAASLIVTALLACVLAASRAAREDPVVALRHE